MLHQCTNLGTTMAGAASGDHRPTTVSSATSASSSEQLPGPVPYVQHPGLSPPDVIVQLDGQHFQAHRSVLTGHSGYFRAVFWASDTGAIKTTTTSNSSTTSTTATEATTRHPALTVVAPPFPSLSAKTFATVLDFLYTSNLYLDVHNVSEVLAGAQQLGIPQAVDACRNFLLHLRHLWYHQHHYDTPDTTTTTANNHSSYLPQLPPYLARADSSPTYPPVAQSSSRPRPVRPIPNRMTFLPALYLHPSYRHHQHFVPHRYTEVADKMAGPPIMAVCLDEQTPSTAMTIDHDTRSTSSSSSSPSTLADSSQALPTTPDLDPGVDSDHPLSQTVPIVGPPIDDGDTRGANSGDIDTAGRREATYRRTSATTNPAITGNKVVIDVACCDGPVKFQRVLNENCSLVRAMEEEKEEENVQEGITPDLQPQSADGQATHQRRSRLLLQRRWLGHMRQLNTDDGLVKVATVSPAEGANTTTVTTTTTPDNPVRNVSSMKSLLEATPHQVSIIPTVTKGGPSRTGEARIYHCIYCQHTFKSRYCYVKHKRRHLNPLTVDSGACSAKNTKTAKVGHEDEDSDRPLIMPGQLDQLSTGPVPATSTTTGMEAGDPAPVMRRPLEINVPFYPCKMCGGKFPSYYFVHKHRRTCNKRLPREIEPVVSLDGESSTGSAPRS